MSMKRNERSYSAKELTIDAMFIALTFVFTFAVNVRLPIAANGGLIHLGNVPLFVGAVLFGRRTGALAGAIGMGLFDLLSGWILWAPFTFIIVGLMGFMVGSIAYNRKGVQWVIFAFLLAMIIKVVGYYLAEVIIYRNWIAPLTSIPGNIVQVGVAAVISLPLLIVVRKIKINI